MLKMRVKINIYGKMRKKNTEKHKRREKEKKNTGKAYAQIRRK